MSQPPRKSSLIAAPPPTGKTSRRASLQQSGRASVDLTGAEPIVAPLTPPASASSTAAGANKPRGSVTSSSSSTTTAISTSSLSAALPTTSTAQPTHQTLFDFFDPLASPQHKQPNDPFHVVVTPPIVPSSSSSSSSSSATASKAPVKKEGDDQDQDDDDDEDEDSSSEEEEEEDDDDEDEGANKKKEENSKKPASQSIHEKVEAKRTHLQLPGQTGPRHTGPPILKVDVLAYMKKGTPFLKYGKQGYPHFRQFQISDDNTTLMWFSKAKKLKDTSISLFNVDELRLGQTTENFARHKAVELAKSSFSLIYNRRAATLDLIAKDVNEYKIWIAGLTEILKMIQSGREAELEKMKSLVCDIIVHAGRRSSVDIKDVISGKTADQIVAAQEEDSQSKLPQVPIQPNSPNADGQGTGYGASSGAGNKLMYAEVAKNFTNLKAKVARRKEELRLQQFYMSPAYDNMMAIVKRMDESIVKINEWFQDGEYGLCDDEIWRAGVDMESLKNMMSAVKP